MKRFIITVVVLSSCANFFSQEYYFWSGNDEKIYLDLLSTKKYILINLPEDTTALRERLALRNIEVELFNISYLDSYGIKFTQKERECWALVEGETSLPNLTDDEAILYESAFFLIPRTITPYMGPTPNKVEIVLTDKLYVKLKQLEDFPVLEQLSTENNVEIYGNNQFMPLWYILSCTKNSIGNAMEIANLFYETKLFDCAQPEFRGGYYPADFAGTDSPKDGKTIYISNGIMYLNTPMNETVSLYSVLGVLLDKVKKLDGEIQVPLKTIDSKMLIVRGSSGWAKKIINQ